MNEILSAICITISAFLLFTGMIEIYINMNDKKDKKSFIFIRYKFKESFEDSLFF